MNSVPQWFNVISIVYHIISFIVAGAIAYLGYKAYRLIKEKKYLNFAVAFFFIMLSFVVIAVTNLVVYLNLDKSAAILSAIISSGFIVYSLLTMGGFFILVLLTFKVKDVKIITILTAGLIAALVFFDFIKIFHLVLLILAVLLSYYFFNNCREKKTTNSKLVFFAFLAMTISHIFHIASSYITAANDVIYVIGSTILVLGYILLLVALLRFK